MMRILVCTLALLLVPAVAVAQSSAVDRGSLLVDGDANFVSVGIDGVDDRTTTLSIRPGVKYFVVPRLAVGGELALGYSSQGDFESTSLGIGPAIDYYFGALDAALHPFVSGSLFFGRDRSDRPTGDLVRRDRRLRGAAGLLYLFSEQVGLDGSLFYETSEVEIEETDLTVSRDAWGLAVGISAFVF